MNHFKKKTIFSELIDNSIKFIDIKPYTNEYMTLVIFFENDSNIFASTNLIPLLNTQEEPIHFDEFISFSKFVKNNDYKLIDDISKPFQIEQNLYKMKTKQFVTHFSINMFNALSRFDIIKFDIDEVSKEIEKECEMLIRDNLKPLDIYKRILLLHDLDEETIRKTIKELQELQ